MNDGSPYLYFLLQLPDEARKRMRAGTRYALVPAARDGGARFRAAGLAITAE